MYVLTLVLVFPLAYICVVKSLKPTLDAAILVGPILANLNHDYTRKQKDGQKRHPLG